MKFWTASEAKAKFAALLRAARTEGPQIIRQSGKPDIVVSTSVPWVPTSYVVDATARKDAYEIVVDQYHLHQGDGHGSKLVAEMHLPPNLSGDVLGEFAGVVGFLRVRSPREGDGGISG